ncbi:PEP/pyruvate-binding domain-containing protein [Sphingomonas psychrotolerans]|uniref:Phosphoenolpyruvate synthase n=1 Tax=Sphingomonas psychrotolerans TaxID=1327635 RepID=A0A2K8MAW5_9SPHN|nr:PEP/pyruvate-binding domain-containing protein [Sphingomonas psychrotolerans]ATY30987.1 pyruvate, phosphate dikinase [Sphingomonas psychrotolerans]
MDKAPAIAALIGLLLASPPVLRPDNAVGERRVLADGDRIASDAAFDKMARTEGGGRFFELPRVMFAIDRSGARPHVYWIDTRRYLYHFDFLQARYLTLADADSFNAANYSRADRRFVLGAVARYPRLGRYGVELWEGDVVEPELLAAMMQQLEATFHAPLTFKPNSDQQGAAAKRAGLPVIGIEEAYGAREQLVLNGGRAVGRLVLVDEGAEEDLLPGDIALLKAMPIRMPPVAGIVSSTFTTPINHVSLLAKTWGIPNAYRADAGHLWGEFSGRQVVLDTRGRSVTVRLATDAEVRAAERTRAIRKVRAPRSDLAYSGLPALTEQDAGWAPRTGAKAANLAEAAGLARKRPDLRFEVPPGFSVPFAFYEHFVVANGIGASVEALLSDPRRYDPAWRRGALAALRARFAAGSIPRADLAAILARRRVLLGDKGVFVRSSTNAEDLPGFNGAGLYDTVPNVTGSEALEAALKTVWGSLWNERAFAARERAGIDHRAVRAAVLLQIGVDADAAGVMTTIDPFDEQSAEQRIFIAAKRGIGIRVVEGKKIAEQLLYRPELDSVQILTRSQDDVMLHFAPDGGVQEVKVDPNRAVLSDDLVRRLGRIGLAIQQRFGNRPQDIEWLVVGGRIMIVQSRDYVKG